MSKFDCGNWNDLPFQENRPGVKRKVFAMESENMTGSVNELHYGHSKWPHSHPHEQISFILQGECDFYIDEVPHRMTAGAWIVVPPNAEHYSICLSQDVPVLNVDVFSPQRTEYAASYKEYLESLKS